MPLGLGAAALAHCSSRSEHGLRTRLPKVTFWPSVQACSLSIMHPSPFSLRRALRTRCLLCPLPHHLCQTKWNPAPVAGQLRAPFKYARRSRTIASLCDEFSPLTSSPHLTTR
ncbi:hypothetical protein CC85DRAFT_12646 [Cutaneotrichosporon oleaginosum]|uniref:Uncharacterized protein n=1 Tax=Cutaneotrichosporon oleaginosum TaxID=879819 RepID=A0A0J0XCS0_9TREE|nr:uncharacterized protein CC85DRAFT_12646 [Cutaneotrichosporon oleaginosum]KLT38861.1 hypothetical protein CC85DRAFT_12646 [Cutaneotrichosporon oleaginosum]TXT14296.1 hypothetical protein COLE_00489 [Cutaneotrichosporon oleaginosum]